MIYHGFLSTTDPFHITHHTWIQIRMDNCLFQFHLTYLFSNLQQSHTYLIKGVIPTVENPILPHLNSEVDDSEMCFFKKKAPAGYVYNCTQLYTCHSQVNFTDATGTASALLTFFLPWDAGAGWMSELFRR